MKKKHILRLCAAMLFIFVVSAVLLAVYLTAIAKPQQPQPQTISAESFGCEGCNVIFIGMTNVRADHMGVYGYSRNTTPNIDVFAKKSVVFDAAFASSSWTLPSSTSILTSLYPMQHELMNRGQTVFNLSPESCAAPGISCTQSTTTYPILDRNITTLMDVLKSNGYVTAAFTGGFDLDPVYGVTSSFDVNKHSAYNPTTPLQIAGPAIGLEYGSFNYSSAAFADWAAKNSDKRFFAYIQGFDAHCPFSYPEENRAFVGNLSSDYAFNRCYWTFDRADQVLIGNKTYYSLTASYDVTAQNTTIPTSPSTPQLLFSQEDLDYMVALYDGEIQSVDRYVGNVLATLEREGILNNTVVVLFSEHGDMFGKHGRFMRGGPLRGTFYDDVLRVPLIVYNPRFNASSQRRSALVETVDFAPTVLDLLSIPAPLQFVGSSLKPVVVFDATVHDAVYAASTFIPDENNLFFSNKTFIAAVRTKERKLIFEAVTDSSYAESKKPSDYLSELQRNTNEPSVELYDVSNDPQELVNMAKSRPEETQNLADRLFSWLKTTAS